MGEPEKRTYSSFNWIKNKRLNIQVGFGWSSDWASRKPWSMDGHAFPYISINNLTKPRGSLHYWIATFGPAIVIFAMMKRIDPNAGER